jgi:hypothetical protein
MHITTTVRSWGAIALGCICAVGSAAVLFWYVRSPADITTNHVMIALSLIVTLGAGHFMWSSAELSIGGVVRFASFLVLFVCGTAVCVSLSGGRSAEVLLRKELSAGHENAKRTSQEARIIEARSDLRAAKAAADAAEARAQEATDKASEACASGAGPKCKGANLTAQAAKEHSAEKAKLATAADSHYWLMIGELGNMAPQQVANADLMQIAKVISTIRGVDPHEVMQSVELLWPYVLALITEFGTIAFLNYGFGHRRRAVSDIKRELPKQVTVTTAPVTVSDPVLVALKKAQRPVTNDELATLMGVSKAEASRRVSALNGTVRKMRKGRYVEISLPQLH